MAACGYRRLIIGIIILFAIIQAVTAASFSTHVSPIERLIKLNETATFNLTISNSGDSKETFEIYSPDVQWDVTTEPSSDRLLEVEPRKSRDTFIVVRPLYVNPGLYVVGLTIKKSGTSEVTRKNLGIGITRDQPGEYAPSIRAKLDFSDDLDPRQNASMELEIENQNKRDIGSITIKIRSGLINDDIQTTLNPLELKRIPLTFHLDPFTPPQEDALRISIFAQARNRTIQFDMIPFTFTIIPFGGISEKAEEERFLLARTRTLTFTNTGNTPRTKTYKERMSLMQRWFLTPTPDPQLRQADQDTFYVWKIELDPGQEATITLKENYRPLGYTALLIIILVIGGVLLRTPLLIRKAAMVVETKEGGISELKVLITIKNRSSSQLHAVEIVDRVPPIAEVKQDHEVGTMRPSTILSHEHKGTQIKWQIDTLDPHEERILSYKIRTKLSVLGGLNLPPCRIGFKQWGYGRSTVSNMENLFGGH